MQFNSIISVIISASLEEDCVDFQGNTVAHGLLYVPGKSNKHNQPPWDLELI